MVEEYYGLDPKLEERLEAAVIRHSVYALIYLAIGTVIAGLAVLGFFRFPHSGWLLALTIAAGVTLGLFAFHRSVCVVIRHISSEAWLREHEGDMAPRIYGILGLRLRL